MSRPHRHTYLTGLLVTGTVALGAQVLLSKLPAGSHPPEALHGLGSLFTGLTLALGLLAWRDLRRRIPPPPAMDRALWLWTLALMLPVAFAAALWQNGGQHPLTARHARIFGALPVVMFFALVPRPRASSDARPIL